MSAAAGQITVPDRLAETVRASAGERGSAWLAALPTTVAEHLAGWDLTLERICRPGGRHSLIGYVHRADLTPAVLKAGLSIPAIAQEHAALAHWAGRGTVLLLAADPATGVLLLERLYGDIPLRSLAESKAMLESTSLLSRLWVPPNDGHPFPLVADHVAELAAGLRRRRELPAAAEARPLIDEALEAATGLLADEPELLLLHGDFHHGKVLAADRAPWLAISPRPLVGERAYDLAWLARDRMDTLVGSPGPRGAARRRLHQLADAVDVNHDRLRNWTLFRTIEAGLRSLESGDTTTAELHLEFAAWL
ncbi:aminoglycoside phosphotransferase family protein [Kitasatospora sp. MAP5-34]|uniref:aminoglycoside phosphotransferase family protein n=1 Tax=Kitasatospora sp. MAP5-34 TaxID=3035102 RepID=UPI00247346AC|nr:aminoglycoside phosphotransferase family protein [Kitasatospora sp. MAP5-34]MDH6579667.1 streptomycin 6-kinase [Kitasatospora sp. MAP5-34]